jgi:hypothetical protein
MLTMHGHMNVKSPSNINKWQMGFNSAFKGLIRLIPVVERSKAWVFGRSLAETAGSNPTGAPMFVSRKCCVLSGRGLCDGPITRPEESYQVLCVRVWS